jgi:D-threo-aldose 1-dehydrogenase
MYSAVSESAAVDIIQAAFGIGIRYFDTAPLYGFGLSESRLGAGLAQVDRAECIISSKVGYTLVPRGTSEPPVEVFVDTPPLASSFDYSRDAILRSLDESLERLKLSRIDLVYVHDPDRCVSIDVNFDPNQETDYQQVLDETFPALAELRSQGVIGAIGVGMNQWQMLCDFARAADFDCFLLAGRYTLLEQNSVEELLPLCQERNVRIVIGGPYNSGILASGAVDGAYYNYSAAPDHIMEKTRQIEAVCRRHGVALAAAALQFPCGHPAVASVIPGARSVAELEENVVHFAAEIPSQMWHELRELGLLHPQAPLPA